MKPDSAFEIVRRSLANGRLPHAYLIAGEPRGAGLDLARRISALLLCGAADPGARPCGRCGACTRAASGTHPDVLLVEPEKKSRVIGMDAVRETLLPWTALRSYAGGRKVCALLFADRLNEPSANAILKTLEEPPEDTLFLLVSDKPEALLPTIVSRCQRLDLSTGRQPPPEPWRSRVAGILAKHSPANALRQLATAGRFVAVFDEIGELAAEQVEARVRELAEADPLAPETDDATLKALVSVREKELRGAVYQAIGDWYRDLLLLAALREAGTPEGAPEPELCFPEFRDELAARAAKVPVRLAQRFVEFAGRIRQQIEQRNMRPAAVFPHWFAWMR